MRKLLLLAAGISFLSATPLVAADLPYKALPPPAIFNWTGCYAGLNVGGAWANHDLSTSVPAGSNMNAAARAVIITVGTGSADGSGWTGGGQVGCNWQSNSFVLGVEGDFNFLNADAVRDTGNVVVGGPTGRAIDTIGMDWLATLRARVGVAAGTVLFYATGGVAFTRINGTRDFRWSFDPGQCPLVAGLQQCHVGGFDSTRTALIVGGGFEWAFMPSDPRWSFKVEYLYADFGSVTFTTVHANVPTQTADHTFATVLHVVRAGLNLRF